jgi:hypothetical protein
LEENYYPNELRNMAHRCFKSGYKFCIITNDGEIIKLQKNINAENLNNENDIAINNIKMILKKQNLIE